MATRYQFVDDSGETRLAGTIVPDPAGFTPARNVGQAGFAFNGTGEVGNLLTPVALTFDDGDASLVDLTTPAAPTIVTAGTYAFTVSCRPGADTDALALRLLLDDNFYSINTYSGVSAPPDGYTENDTALSATWWCDAADPFFLYVQAQNVGSGVAVATRLLLQRLA